MDKTISISKLVSNENNPRIIKDKKFKKLVESIKQFPEMLKLRPIVVDEEMVILGGNMRFKACQQAGIKEVPIKIAKGLTDKQKKEFVVKDNVGYGEWNWDLLANEWDNRDLKDWGMDVWQPEEVVDYSILEDVNLDSEVEDMADDVRKGILIDFDKDDHEKALELISIHRKAGNYIGGMLMELLEKRKDEINE